MKLMRFCKDTVIQGMLYPAGAVLKVIPSQEFAIIPPSAERMIASVMMKELTAVQAYQAMVLNREVGLMALIEIYGEDEYDARLTFENQGAPCDILSLQACR